MKRYFLISGENKVFDVICNHKAMELMLEDLRTATNIASLEEVSKEEYNSLANLSN